MNASAGRAFVRLSRLRAFLFIIIDVLHLSDLHSLNAQTQRGLVCNTGDHCDAVISHLVEVGVIVIGDGCDDSNLIGFCALVGLVSYSVADFRILQLTELRTLAAIVTEQTDIPIIETGATVMTGTL